MGPVPEQEPEVSTFCVRKGRPQVGAITKCLNDDDDDCDNADGSSSLGFTAC